MWKVCGNVWESRLKIRVSTIFKHEWVNLNLGGSISEEPEKKWTVLSDGKLSLLTV